MKMDGIFENISNEDYHASEGISNTAISLILDCPARYYHQYLSEKKIKKETTALTVGSLIHALVLEPHLVDSKFTIVPKDVDIRLSSKKGKTNFELLSLAGLPLIKFKDYIECKSIADAVRQHRDFEGSFLNAKIENSFFSTDEDGVALKCRPDFYNDFMLCDLKTTVNCDPREFEKTIMSYGYHRQAAINLDIATKLTGRFYDSFLFVVVEKKPPYLCEFFLIGDESIDQGRKEYKTGIEIYKKCLSENKWPSYGKGIINQINLPAWYFNKN